MPGKTLDPELLKTADNSIKLLGFEFAFLIVNPKQKIVSSNFACLRNNIYYGVTLLFSYLVEKTGLKTFIKRMVQTAPASVTKLQQWLYDCCQTKDVIATATTIAGFEWPSILMITSTVYESQFHVRNIVMRSMCKLVWLKTNIIDQVYELNVSANLEKATDTTWQTKQD